VTDERHVPQGVDVTTPNVARMWDYQLGGKDNFAADRAAAAALNLVVAAGGAPEGHAVASENRGFIHRAVRFLAAEAGIRQFIDIGAGLPTQGNVHEVAQAAAPGATVAYIDYDPVVVAHGRALLGDSGSTRVIHADLRDPSKLLANPELRDHIDFDQPVAVMLVAVLHLIGEADDPAGIVKELRDAIAPGSYLAITHATRQNRPEAAAALAEGFARLRVTTPMVPRSADEIAGFFDGFELIDPGLVFPALWRPESPGDTTGAAWMLSGVGRKS
jgi:SAM-dependent methyltransferase